MLYILENNNKQANWVNDFEKNLSKGLAELQIDGGNILLTERLELDRDIKLTENDYIFVMNFKDLDRFDIRNTKAKIICHVNGTSANPYAYNVNRLKELEQFLNVIDIITFSSDYDRKLTIERYPFIKNKAITIGFPLDFNKYKSYQNHEKKKKIIIGGRISPDKQFYLTTYLLKDLLNEYEIVFSVVDKDKKWSEFYDIQRFIDMGFQFRFNNNSVDFYNELKDSEIFFTASLGDTICISLIEAYLCNCYIVAPKIEDSFPCWNSYYKGGYEPFCKSDIEDMIRNKSEVKFEINLFDYKKVCQRLIENLSL